jgi:hypothetical protein
VSSGPLSLGQLTRSLAGCATGVPQRSRSRCSWRSLRFPVVRLGSVNWQYTRGPLGLTIGVVLLLEIDPSPLVLIATLSTGPLLAVARERCLDSGLVVIVSPLPYLLAPFTVLADLLGFRDGWRRSEGAQIPSVARPDTAPGSCARPHPPDDTNRIHPPKARPNRPSTRR